MNLKKWLKGATRIRFDDRTLGNLLKNGAVAAGTIVGGPAGLAIGGIGSAAGQAALGGNFGESLNAGLKGAGTVGGLSAGKSLLKNAISGGGAPVAGVPSPAATDAVSHGGLKLPGMPNLTTVADAPFDPRSLATKALDVGKSAGSFALKNPNAAGSALQGIGNLATAGAQNRGANAQATLLEQEADANAYDLERRKRRDLELAPLYESLGMAFGNSLTSSVAPNPYATGG